MCRDLDLSNCVQITDASLRALVACISELHIENDANEATLVWESLQLQDRQPPRLVSNARLHVEVCHNPPWP